ncbi:MAG: hypothetical protein O7F16_13395 [Acidobacteria bacterium]|nr:hypothetical protein [Acidobacteriota bacterium]
MAATLSERIFRRTLGARLLSAAAAALFSCLMALTILQPPADGMLGGALVCGLLLLLSLAAVAVNFGDRIVVDATGVRFRNLWRERLRIGGTRLLRWDEVEEVRELQRARRTGTLPGAGTLVVRTRSGRRYVIDSIEGIEEVAALLRQGAGLSGPCPGRAAPRG